MASAPVLIISPEEYLRRERASDERHEYFAGRIYAMSGASREHSMICSNTLGSLWNQLRGKPCEVHSSDLRVQVSDTGLYTYPDLSVVCGKKLFADEHVDTLLNPKIVIEVLSPSTEAYDRGDKFAHYRTLDSLTDYLLIAQDKPRIEHYRRSGDE